MTGFVDEFSTKFSDAVVTSGILTKERCSVDSEGVPYPHVVIDLDMKGSPFSRQDNRCDFLFIAEDSDGSHIFAPLELKSGKLDASRVVKQLQAGVDFLNNKIVGSSKINIVPVAVSGSNPRAQLDKLKKPKYRVRFRGKYVAVSYLKCGDKLAQALPIFGSEITL